MFVQHRTVGLELLNTHARRATTALTYHTLAHPLNRELLLYYLALKGQQLIQETRRQEQVSCSAHVSVSQLLQLLTCALEEADVKRICRGGSHGCELQVC